MEAPAIVRARSVVLDEFLAPAEIEELIRYTLAHESDFADSEVIAPSGEPGVTDYSHRRSRVLTDLGLHEELILKRIRGVLPNVQAQLGIADLNHVAQL